MYLVKAILNYQKDFTQSKADYQKAVTLLSEGGKDPKSVSFSLVGRDQNDYKASLDILDQQRDAAERNYQDMRNRAKRDYDDANIVIVRPNAMPKMNIPSDWKIPAEKLIRRKETCIVFKKKLLLPLS